MKLSTLLFLLLAFSLVRPQAVRADSVWELSLGGTPPGTWYLELESVASTVTISSFTTTAKLGPSSTSGNVTGTLTQLPVVLSPVSEYLQQITSAGTSGLSSDTLEFNFVLSPNLGTQGQPDLFDVIMLGSNGLSISTGDPTGANAVLRGYSASSVQTFGTAFFNSVTIVPEPATFLLTFVGCGWGWFTFHHGQRLRKRSRNFRFKNS